MRLRSHIPHIHRLPEIVENLPPCPHYPTPTPPHTIIHHPPSQIPPRIIQPSTFMDYLKNHSLTCNRLYFYY